VTDARPFPLPGMLIALATGGVLYLAGAGLWLAVLVLVVWIGTLWLPSPAPTPRPTPVEPDAMQLTLTGMGELIEHSGLPVLILDGERIVLANAMAREVFGGHVLTQDARVAFRHPGAIELLARRDGGSATIPGLTGPRSNWQMTRQQIDERFSLVELVNRTAEADISRAHTDFVANASHELRTPLASIIGYMETLVEQGENADPKRAAKFHGTVLREAKRLQNLVDDLMSLSRIEAEKHDQPRDPVDLTLLVPQAARDGAGADRQERLELKVARGPLQVRGDHRQLEQLVRNLVDNAFKYGAVDEPVAVGLTRNGGGMILTVRDRGEGIAAEHIPHLTRRFYRTDPGRSRAAGGTGLGLAIVKHIVERHRGQLDIASKHGDGTTVTVRLPAAD
jgi:two-component system phosphate regulon sensor histidine kinase PhoR